MNDATAWTPALAADQHTWDGFDHAVWDNVPVTQIQIADIIASTLQVQGIAAAEHRGKPALRFDVENVAQGGKGRLVLAVDNVLCDVKRYTGNPGYAATRPQVIAATRPTPPKVLLDQPDEAGDDRRPAPGSTGDLIRIAREWAEAAGKDDEYDTDDQALFGLLCDAAVEYAGLNDVATVDGDLPASTAFTLGAVVANVCPGWVITDDHARRAR